MIIDSSRQQYLHDNSCQNGALFAAVDGEEVEMEVMEETAEAGEGHEAEGTAGSSKRDPKKRIYLT